MQRIDSMPPFARAEVLAPRPRVHRSSSLVAHSTRGAGAGKLG